MKKNTKMVVVGRIGRIFGIKGWMKLHSFTEPMENILNYKQWYIFMGNSWEPITPEDIKIHGKGLLIKFLDLNTPEQAQIYTNADIGITSDQLPKLTTNDYYWSDLEGLKVINTAGEELGTVAYLFATGANDIMVVKGSKERLLPYIKQVVLKVDLQQGTILVDWGLDF